jgi:hypothetical protein
LEKAIVLAKTVEPEFQGRRVSSLEKYLEKLRKEQKK